MSFRKEKKYRISFSELFQIQSDLLDVGMSQLYPKRIVSSCYFDTDNLSLFHDSEEGTLPRKKIRLRWYDNIINPKKEQKISSVEGRHKIVESVNGLNTENDVYKLSYTDQIYGVLKPKLVISYTRQYFMYESLRITFDRDILYRYLVSNTFDAIEDNECVMEVKVPFDVDDAYIENLVPFPTSRFSKYSRGMLVHGL